MKIDFVGRLILAEYCECGCGKIVHPGRRFIFPHHVRCFSTDVIERRANSLSKTWARGEHGGLGRKQSKEEIEKRMASIRGKRRTKEQKANISNGLKRAYRNLELRKLQSERLKRAYVVHPEYGRAISERLKGKPLPESTRKAQILAITGKPSWNRGIPMPKEQKKEIKSSLIKYWHSPKGLRHKRKIISNLLNDPEKYNRWIENLKSSHKGIKQSEQLVKKRIRACKKFYRENRSSIEVKVDGILKSLNIDYEIQKGVGKFLVDFYVPSCGLIIECDGDYWHGSEEAKDKDRVKDLLFREQGFEILRLTETEINEDIVKCAEKITDRIFYRRLNKRSFRGVLNAY